MSTVAALFAMAGSSRMASRKAGARPMSFARACASRRRWRRVSIGPPSSFLGDDLFQRSLNKEIEDKQPLARHLHHLRRFAFVNISIMILSSGILSEVSRKVLSQVRWICLRFLGSVVRPPWEIRVLRLSADRKSVVRPILPTAFQPVRHINRYVPRLPFLPGPSDRAAAVAQIRCFAERCLLALEPVTLPDLSRQGRVPERE